MKRILTGIDAYNKMLTTPLPEKTKTYTPVSHMEVTNLVRKQLGFLGYRLQNEHYSSNQTGTVATVAFVFEYVADPEMSMTAVFVNSYDKSAKFQFKLGGMSKKHGNLIISEGFGGSHIRRKHTGSAVEIINDHISQSLYATSMVWLELQKFKTELEDFRIALDGNTAAQIVGQLMLQDIADSTQLSNVRDLIRAHDITATLWDFYHICAASLRSTHPKLWHQSHTRLSKIFGDVVEFYEHNPFVPASTPEPEPEAEQTEIPYTEPPEEDEVLSLLPF